MFKIVLVVFTSDNDQVKTGEKDYVNVKPGWPVCVYVGKKALSLFEKFSYFF